MILCEKEFQKLGIEARVATEDGSYGRGGMVTELLRELLSTLNSQLSIIIYACGPKDMLREVAKISISSGVRSQASLEENMGCGVGACLGCVVKVKSKKPSTLNFQPLTTNSFVYKRVCKDGPIFDLDDVIW